MDINAIMIGAGTSLGWQVLKPGYNRWVQLALAVLAAFTTAAIANGGWEVEKGLTAALAALATHGAFLADTSVGKALQWNLISRILDGLAEVAKNLAPKS